MADKKFPITEATAGTLDNIDTKIATNGNGDTVLQQRVVIAADETTPIANPLPVQVGDGTHTMPTGDAAARAIHMTPGDGTHEATFKAASTESAFTDTALVTAPRPTENHIGEVGSPTATPSANFNRPANTTAYASGQLVANSTTAVSVTPLAFTAARVAAGSFMVRRAKLKKSGTTITLATYRMHLFTTAPTVTNGDGGTLVTNENGYLGAIDLDMTGANGHVWGDSATVIGVPNVGSEMNVKLASGQTIYALLEARAAYVPASGETFTGTLELLQN